MMDKKFIDNSDDQLENLPLHDIQGLVEVNDHSLVIFIAVVLLALFLTLAVLYFIWKYFSKRRKTDIRKEAYEALSSVDLDNVKHAAYEITRLGLIFKDDSERLSSKYYSLTQKLDKYKYKKSVDDKLDQDTVSYYKIFLDMIEV